MSAIDDTFRDLAAKSETAFMPFVTAGDPDLSFTGELLKTLSNSGAHLVELGFPYSDPIADGPVIQASYTRALNNKVTVNGIFEMLSAVSPQLRMPIVAMVSYAIILRYGPEKFIERASAAGISGAIVPDLPADESPEFVACCRQHDFSWIQLITPTTPDDRAIRIANQSTGFIYYVSIAGITGARTVLPDGLLQRLAWLKQHTKTPICVGFGISQTDQLALLKPHADGLIVGSTIVKRIAAAANPALRQNVLDELPDFVRQMIRAMDQ